MESTKAQAELLNARIKTNLGFVIMRTHTMQPGQINKALNSKPGENLQTVAIDKEKYMLNNNRQNTFAFEQGLSTQFLYFVASFVYENWVLFTRGKNHITQL